MPRRLLLALLSCALLVPTLCPAADLAAPVPLDPAVTTGTLPNGLRYFVRQNAKPEQRAALWLVVGAGSVDEDDDQQGLAHLIEHMAFNGTENFPKQALVSYLESIGMQFGPEVNAYTSQNETVYMLQVPTDQPGLLDTGLRILEDWAHRVSFDEAEVDKERGVVIEEWRLGRGADERMGDAQLPVIFHGSRYGQRNTIGDPEILRNAPYETLRRFYRDWYRPDLMAVVAVGDFDRAPSRRRSASRPSTANAPLQPRCQSRQVLYGVATDPSFKHLISLLFKHAPDRRSPFRTAPASSPRCCAAGWSCRAVIPFQRLRLDRRRGGPRLLHHVGLQRRTGSARLEALTTGATRHRHGSPRRAGTQDRIPSPVRAGGRRSQ
jgi:zinc protease